MKREIFFLLIIACFGIPLKAYSDDSYVTVKGGAAQAMQEHPTVSMDEEYVKIVLHDSSYTVTADFTFYNAGPSTTVAVGFPFGGHDPLGTKQLQGYKTWINGLLTETKEVRHHEDLQPDYYYFPQIWKVKTVNFPSQKKTKTAVSYTAPYGVYYQSDMVASYVYGSGRTWAGPIKRAVFEFDFDDEMLIDPTCRAGFKVIHRSRGQLVVEMNNYEPKKIDEGTGLAVASMDTLLKALTNDPGAVETRFAGKDDYCLSMMGDAEGEWACRTALDKLPREIDKYGCRGDLQTLSLAQLRLLRNRVFAKKGRIFTDPKLDKYFRFFPWYKPDTSDVQLSAEDKQVVEEISQVEATIKKTPPYVFNADTVDRDNIKSASQTIKK